MRLPDRNSLSASVAALLAIVGMALAGCVVGPDYHGPPDAAPIASRAHGFHRADAQQTSNAPPPANWWEALKDPELDRLETAALQDSPNLAVAEARLRRARAALKEARANQLPTVSSSALYLHSHIPDLGSFVGGQSSSGTGTGSGQTTQGSSGGSDVDFYDVGFDAVWEFDIFGGQRRATQSAKAQAQAQAASLDDVRVSLAAEVASEYVTLRDLQHRLELIRASAEAERRMLDLTRQRRAQGTASDLDVERLNTQFESTRGNLIPLQAQIAEAMDRLAVLTGREPGTLDAELGTTTPTPNVPAMVPIGDPASLIRRRPDIRAAERTLAASNAVIGQRVADYFPKVNLIGTIGWGSTDLGSLFSGDNLTYVAAPILQWNVFDFGRTRSRVAQARAARDEAEAQYRQTVLAALQDAETSLARFGRQRDAVVNLARVKASADRSAVLMDQRERAGTATLIDTLDAERTRLSAEQNLAVAEAQLTTDYVALQKSLGLGWDEPAAAR